MDLDKRVLSRFQTLASERPDHFVSLGEAVTAQIQEYSDQRQRETDTSDFVGYMSAKWVCIGYSAEQRCDLNRWYQTAGYRDPFVEGVVQFMTEERQVGLAEDESQGAFFMKLTTLAGNAFGWLPSSVLGDDGYGVAWGTSVRATNDAIIVLARAIDATDSLTSELSSREFTNTGASYGSLVAAAKIIKEIFAIYSVEELSVPSLA